MNLVFVYGTLLNGHYNHSYLENSQFVSKHITSPDYTMVNLGLFPAILLKGNTAIHGEIYKVDETTLEQLDILEGYPEFYNRISINTKYGDAYMYVLNDTHDQNHPVIESGIWE